MNDLLIYNIHSAIQIIPLFQIEKISYQLDQQEIFYQFINKLQSNFDYFIMIDESMKNLTQKIRDIDFKLDGLLIRMQMCEKYLQKLMPASQPEEINILQKYLSDYSPIPSPMSQVAGSEYHQHTRWHSQPQYGKSVRFHHVQVKQNVLDSKSFGAIKRSILLNGQQIEEMQQKLIAFEQEYLNRILSVQEGVQILTRLSQMLEQKMQKMNGGENSNAKSLKEKEKYHAHERKRVVDKYRKRVSTEQKRSGLYQLHGYDSPYERYT